MLKTSPDRFDHRSAEPLPATALTIWSLRDAVCWPGRQPEETTRESSCGLCRCGNCRRGAHRLVDGAAAAVELGFWLTQHETCRSFGPCSPRRRAHAPRQELARRVRGRPRSGRPCCGRPGPGPVQRRSWYRPLAGAVGCRAGTEGGLVPDRKRGDAGTWARGWRARAQPFRAASLRRDDARRHRQRYCGIRPARLPDRHRHALRLGVSLFAPAADRRGPALRRRRDSLADRSDARAPQVPAVVASAGHPRMRDRCAAPAVRRIRGISHRRCQLRQVRENLTIEASTLSANVDREIIGEIERLQALAASLSLRQGDFAEFQRQAEAALGLPQSGNIVLIDRNMQQLVNTRVPFGQALPKAVVPKPIARSLATGKPQVTDLFMVPIVDQLLVGIIVPVEIDGESRYVVGRTPDQHALARLVAANELPTGWHAVVSDAAHRIISRSEEEGLFIGKELPPAQWRRTGPGDVFEFIDSEGRPSLEASATSELTGWETAVWAPKALLEAPVRAQWWTLGVMALLAFVLVVALALWLGRIIARSVGHAARAAIALGEGGPLPLGGTPVAEVDTLMAELRGAAARRQVAEDLLRDSERHLFASKGRLQIAMDAAQLGWWQYDPRHRMLSGDRRSKEIFDITADETPVEEIKKRVHPDDAERFWAAR